MANRNRSRWVAAVAGLGLLALPGLAAAQVKLIPQIGVYSPVEELGSVGGVDGAYDIGRYESTLAYGGALEFGSGHGISFRIGGLYASNAEIPISGIGCSTACPADVDLLSLNTTLIIRPLGELFFVTPYGIGGIGVKRYDYAPADLPGELDDIFSDNWDRAGVLGVGAEVDLGGAAFVFELTDHFHWARQQLPGEDRDRLDDFFFTIGLVLGGGR